MEDKYSLFNKFSSSEERSSKIDEDFDEEDVWSVVVKEKTDKSPKHRQYLKGTSSSVSTTRRLPTVSRMIPKANTSSTHDTQFLQQSAPVNIPDWSKIYKKDLKKSSYIDGDGDYGDVVVNDDDVENDDDDGEGDDKVPPHEWIAKKLARSQISSFSVYEGVGRTLKGRDLSKVRNAVLTRTGFLE